jgi:hypothetical protein
MRESMVAIVDLVILAPAKNSQHRGNTSGDHIRDSGARRAD